MDRSTTPNWRKLWRRILCDTTRQKESHVCVMITRIDCCTSRHCFLRSVIKPSVRSLDVRSRCLQSFAARTHENAQGLRQQLASTTDSAETPEAYSLSPESSSEGQRSRWETSAKQLADQLDHRTHDVHRFKTKLEAVLATATKREEDPNNI